MPEKKRQKNPLTAIRIPPNEKEYLKQNIAKDFKGGMSEALRVGLLLVDLAYPLTKTIEGRPTDENRQAILESHDDNVKKAVEILKQVEPEIQQALAFLKRSTQSDSDT